MSLISIFLFVVCAIVVFGVLGWLIRTWITDAFMQKLAFSALVVLAVLVFLYFVMGGMGSLNAPLWHR